MEGWRAEVAGAVPAAAVLAIAVFMAAQEGGFAPTVWYPVALVVLALVVTVALAVPDRGARAPRAPIVALASLAAFTAWSFASIWWAEARADAWDGANRTLLYLLVLVLLARWPVSARCAWLLAFAFVLAAAVVGVVTVERLVHTSDVESLTIGSRLSAPFGYPNATAAFFMIALWLAIGLASRRWLPAVVRGASLGLAVLLAGLNLLAASRGSVYALPAVVATYLALVPGRLRSILSLGLVAAALAPAVGPLLAVYRSGGGAHLQRAAQHGLWILLALAAGLAVVGVGLALVDRRLAVSPGVTRVAGIAVVCAALAALGGTALAIHPVSRVHTAWQQFRHAGEPVGTTHFGGLGSNRYDFWRVGVEEFAAHPATGIGADNFLVQYLQKRSSAAEEPLYPHSLWVRLLSQTGIVGTGLFVAFLTASVLAVARLPRGPGREIGGVLLVAFSVWIWHGLVDWLWEMPALGVTAVALLGLALGLGAGPRGGAARRGSRARALVGAVAALAAGTSLALPWLSERGVQAAAAVWRQDPAAAFARLDSARSLNPLSDRADVVAGAIASRLRRYELMRERFARAVGRAPEDWYAHLELGVAASLTGDAALAGSELRRAERLNPREPIVRAVLGRFRAGRRIDPAAVDRQFLQAG